MRELNQTWDTAGLARAGAQLKGLGYELRVEPGENPLVVVAHPTAADRRVAWRTRTMHTLWGLIRMVEIERGVK